MQEIRRGSVDPTLPSVPKQLVVQEPVENDLDVPHLSGSENEAVIYVDKDTGVNNKNMENCITVRDPQGCKRC